MRRNIKLSIIHHIRQSSKSDVSRICNASITEANESWQFRYQHKQRKSYGSKFGGIGLADYSLNLFLHNYPIIYSPRFYSTSPKSSPFSESVNNSKSPDFSNLPGARLPKSSSAKPTRVLEITKEQANEAFKNCLQLIRKHDIDSFNSILMMPKAAQAEFIACNSVNVELAQIRDKIDTRHGDTSAIYRLQFWKDAISSIYGLSSLPVPRQPVAIALCVFAPNARADLLLKLVEARQMTIGDRPFENINELLRYGRLTTGSLLSLQIDALARTRNTVVLPPIYELAEELGSAFAVANLIRSAHPLLARGIVLIPSDVMALNGVSPDSLYKKKQLDDTKGVVRDLIKESVTRLANVRSQIDLIPKEIRHAFCSTAATIDWIIKKCEKVNYDIYSPHLQRSNPLLLWKLLIRRISGKF